MIKYFYVKFLNLMKKNIFNGNYSLIINKDNIEINVYKRKKLENYFFVT